MIRAVISDFGGVLTTPPAGSFKAFSKRSAFPWRRSAARWRPLPSATVTVAQRDGMNPLHELECGRVTEASFMEAIGATLSEHLGRDVGVVGFAADCFDGLGPRAPMIELMASLRDTGLRMALLTNNVREWDSRWRAMATIEELFELVVNSLRRHAQATGPLLVRLITDGRKGWLAAPIRHGRRERAMAAPLPRLRTPPVGDRGPPFPVGSHETDH